MPGAAGGAAAAGRLGQEYQPNNMSEAELMAQAMRLSRLEHEQAQQRRAAGVANGGAEGAFPAGAAQNAGRQAPIDEMAEAVRRAKLEEEAAERARLREEQAAEYEESLRIDREREEELQRRQREEEEEKRLELERIQKETEAAQAEKERIATIMEEARQKLKEEPGPEEKRVTVALKFPDGRRMKRAFRAEDDVAQIYYFANSEAGESLASREYHIVEAMPRRVYEDRSATLETAGLQGQCALLVELLD